MVGSLAHADPAGEMTAVLALFGGSVELASARGHRTVGAADFFVGPMEPCLQEGELATAAYFPAPAGVRERPFARWRDGTATTRCAGSRRR